MSILKREYVVIPLYPQGSIFTLKTKQPTYHSTSKKNIAVKFFNQKRIQKENYKNERKNNNNKKENM